MFAYTYRFPAVSFKSQFTLSLSALCNPSHSLTWTALVFATGIAWGATLDGMIVATGTEIPATNLVVLRTDNWAQYRRLCQPSSPARPSSNSQSGNAPVCINGQLKGDRNLGTLRAVSLLGAAAVRATPNGSYIFWLKITKFPTCNTWETRLSYLSHV